MFELLSFCFLMYIHEKLFQGKKVHKCAKKIILFCKHLVSLQHQIKLKWL
jgi:hypothetical protein